MSFISLVSSFRYFILTVHFPDTPPKIQGNILQALPVVIFSVQRERLPRSTNPAHIYQYQVVQVSLELHTLPPNPFTERMTFSLPPILRFNCLRKEGETSFQGSGSLWRTLANTCLPFPVYPGVSLSLASGSWHQMQSPLALGEFHPSACCPSRREHKPFLFCLCLMQNYTQLQKDVPAL